MSTLSYVNMEQCSNSKSRICFNLRETMFGMPYDVMIGHVSAAHRPCNQPHPVHTPAPRARNGTCVPTPKVPRSSESAISLSIEWTQAPAMTSSAPLNTHYRNLGQTMVGLGILPMRGWPGSHERETSPATLYDAPFCVGNLTDDRLDSSSLLEMGIPWGSTFR